MSNEVRLISSIPANNQKIIELYQKLQSGRLNVSPDFQRKLVWRRQHKIEFIETILKNYPFPEVYLAPEKVDTDKLELRELVVDGQQRLTTIQDYIAEQGIFAQATSLPKFSDLPSSVKEDFLNYEVSVRYLKNASPQQIKDIFQRINRTDYSLNRMERFHAAWGDSELMCLAKQIIESELEINLEIVDFRVPDDQRNWLLQFFGVGNDDGVFSESEVNRMMNLQYILVLLVTLLKGEYFHRNTAIEAAVSDYNERVPDAGLLIQRLISATKLIGELGIPKDSFWLTKSSLFTLIVELSQFELARINSAKLGELMRDEEGGLKADPKVLEYYGYTREAVNEKRSRESRGKFVRELILQCIQP